MRVTITPGKLHGRIKAIASKSAAHRLLILAALADGTTQIVCEELSEDIEATAEALRQTGTDIRYDAEDKTFHVNPAGHTSPCRLDVGESGSTLRFLLPVVCALGLHAKIVMHGRLSERPLSPLKEELERHGCRITRNIDGTIETQGKLTGGEFRMAGDVSSQFISGLLFALPVLSEPSSIRLYGQVESEGYIRMTMPALEVFGVRTDWEGEILTIHPAAERQGFAAEKTDRKNSAIPAGYVSPGFVRTEGDWSNAAFWEVAGMLTDGDGGSLVSYGLKEDSIQGDRAVRQLKKVIAAGDALVDARHIPDLVPVLSVLAAVSPGTTVFTHAERLRLKESDRIRSTVCMLRALGGDVQETEDGLTVHGRNHLDGGCVDSCHDHRIAMSAAVASIACENTVVSEGAEAVNKSYPGFWDDFVKLGGQIIIEPS